MEFKDLVQLRRSHRKFTNEDIDGDVFIAGAKEADGKLLTSGGRVLGVTCIADSLKDAIDASYGQVEKIHFDNAYYRKDIGRRALQANGSQEG